MMGPVSPDSGCEVGAAHAALGEGGETGRHKACIVRGRVSCKSLKV